MEINHTDPEFRCCQERRRKEGAWDAGSGGLRDRECVLAGGVPRTRTHLLGRLFCWGDPESGGPPSEDCPQMFPQEGRGGGVPPVGPTPPCPQHPPGCPLLAFRAGCPSPEFVITRVWHPLRCGDNVPPLVGVLILLICPTGVHLGPLLEFRPDHGLSVLQGPPGTQVGMAHYWPCCDGGFSAWCGPCPQPVWLLMGPGF